MYKIKFTYYEFNDIQKYIETYITADNKMVFERNCLDKTIINVISSYYVIGHCNGVVLLCDFDELCAVARIMDYLDFGLSLRFREELITMNKIKKTIKRYRKNK